LGFCFTNDTCFHVGYHFIVNLKYITEGTASVQEAAKKMKDNNVSSLVVVDGDGEPQGLVTERD
jgi:CBS domain-containing protein